jgi:hypothetical protein
MAKLGLNKKIKLIKLAKYHKYIFWTIFYKQILGKNIFSDYRKLHNLCEGIYLARCHTINVLIFIYSNLILASFS